MKNTNQPNNTKNSSIGKLYIVSTPIGNMQDITLRALDTLKNVDIILAERRTTMFKILSKFDIGSKKVLTYREDNHSKLVNFVLNNIKQGKDIALVSEAGTPVISDPGLKLLKDLYKVDKTIKVITVPGPSAVTASFSIFSLASSTKFMFLGFAPVKSIRICKLIKQNLDLFLKQKLTLIYFISPKLVVKALNCLKELQNEFDLPNNNLQNNEHIENVQINVGLAKELTKIHEELIQGSINEVVELVDRKVQANSKFLNGEFVLLISFNNM